MMNFGFFRGYQRLKFTLVRIDVYKHCFSVFDFKNKKFSRIVCVCGRSDPDPSKTPKTFFRQKKLSQKKFLAEKNVRDFFTNFKIKKFFKILENIFLDFSFSKKH
jgi:hypothetical protein